LGQILTYIIIVNWNGWRDTLECLESVFRLRTSPYRVIVCDNGSSDGSLARIEEWARGQEPAPLADLKMAGHSRPPCPKPVSCQCLTRAQAKRHELPASADLILIDCETNLGFAGANNVGLRFALSQKDMGWAWLLNNDTVADASALAALVDKMARTPTAGIVGSTLIYYHHPDKVQAFGGARYFPLIGLSMHIGRFRNRRRLVDEQTVESRMRYVIGASLFVSRDFVETVGLMSEEYFLYYEELDWALRARGRFSLAYAQNSLVFHKVGATIGSSNRAVYRSLLSDYYLMGNRLKITAKFFPSCRFTVRIMLGLESLLRLLQRRGEHAALIWRIIRGRQQSPPLPRDI